jgi:hypothetical protein
LTGDTVELPAIAERDWVWEFDGQHLRAIAHYKASDAAQVLAIRW